MPLRPTRAATCCSRGALSAGGGSGAREEQPATGVRSSHRAAWPLRSQAAFREKKGSPTTSTVPQRAAQHASERRGRVRTRGAHRDGTFSARRIAGALVNRVFLSGCHAVTRRGAPGGSIRTTVHLIDNAAPNEWATKARRPTTRRVSSPASPLARFGSVAQEDA